MNLSFGFYGKHESFSPVSRGIITTQRVIMVNTQVVSRLLSSLNARLLENFYQMLDHSVQWTIVFV